MERAAILRAGAGLIFLLWSSVALASTEICGDGIDNDSSGGDQACPEPDKDFDGYESGSGSGNDCDDTDRYMYPGIQRTCGTNGYQTCQASGSFNTCVENSVTPLCEATGSGSCYYIDDVNGSDSNDGSYGSPWKTYLQFVTYYQEGDKPSGHHDPVPGDVFYFFDGTYDDTYLYNGSTEHFFMRNKDGTSSNKIMMKAFPGETSVVFQELYILQTEYWIFEGLTVTAGNNGFRLEEGDFGEIRNCHIYDTNGVENNNDSGIKMTDCENWNIHHNRIHDNYDREDLQQNNANIQTFTGTGNTFTRNVVYNASTGLSACIKAKHGTSGGDWTVSYNAVWNCEYVAIGGAQPGLTATRNIITDSAAEAFRFDELGGPHYIDNHTITYNTVINGEGLQADYDDTTLYGDITFQYNVVVSDASSFGENNAAMVSICKWCNDTKYAAVHTGGVLTIDSNCWDHASLAIQFGLFQKNPGDPNTLGGMYTFTNWQGQGYDTSSYEVDPNFSSANVAQAASCSSWGYLQEASSGGGGGSFLRRFLTLKPLEFGL